MPVTTAFQILLPLNESKHYFKGGKAIHLVHMERGYFQNKLFTVKGLNTEPMRNEAQALTNVTDFLLFKMKVPPRAG